MAESAGDSAQVTDCDAQQRYEYCTMSHNPDVAGAVAVGSMPNLE